MSNTIQEEANRLADTKIGDLHAGMSNKEVEAWHDIQESFLAGALSESSRLYWQEQGWVSVEERLPEALTSCLVWYTANGCYPHVRTATFMGGDFFSTSGIEHRTFKVTHWMYQPSPPGSTPSASREGKYKAALDEILRHIVSEHRKPFDGDFDKIIDIATEALKH